MLWAGDRHASKKKKDKKANHSAHYNIWQTLLQSPIPVMLRTLLLGASPKIPRHDNLHLPSTYMLIQKARDQNVLCPWDDHTVIKPADMTPAVVATRHWFRAALQQRFINTLLAHVHRIYSIAALMDPRFKKFRLMTDEEKDMAHQQLPQECEDNWKPRES